MKLAHLLLAAGLLLAGCDGAPAEAPTQAEVPALTGRVVDRANLLSTGEAQALSRLSEELERRTSDQLVMVTLPDLGGRTIEQVAREVGNSWRIGQRDKDNGVLIVVVPREGAVRIAVGYGLDPILTDLRAKQIIDSEMLPRLRQARWYEAIDAGARAVSATLTQNAHIARQGR